MEKRKENRGIANEQIEFGKLSNILLWLHIQKDKKKNEAVRNLLRNQLSFIADRHMPLDFGAAYAKVLERLQTEHLGFFIEMALNEMILFTDNLELMRISWTTCLDLSYPRKLLDLEDFPLALFYRGEINLLSQSSVSVVGSRQPSYDGKAMCEMLGAYLEKRHQVVVSGLAFGVDALIHQSMLSREGKTVVVLPSGLLTISPSAHRPLADHIVKKGGLLITEMLPQDKPMKHSYLERNRLIAALSLQVVIVEAGLNSGSMNTASCAFNLNRQVYAMPGSIRNPVARGANQLLKEGASAFTEPEDIYIEGTENAIVDQRANFPKDSVAFRVMAHLSRNGLTSIDDLASAINEPIENTLPVVMELTLENLVAQYGSCFKASNTR